MWGKVRRGRRKLTFTFLSSLYYDAKTKEVKALNGSGRSPAALNLAKTKELGLKGKEIGLLDLNS